ncbi:MAG TPA: DUF2007 domain-containing protein [Candidatus Kapabacteria bacterium]|nr:DUF2007 domain-containing protein [Candidatus Kapabacteria bacterium]
MSRHVKCEICLNHFEEQSICPFCGSKIDISIDENTEWAVCYVTNDIMEATYLHGLLEGGAIPSQILSQIDSTRMFTIGELAIVKLMVPTPYLQEAQGAIAKLLKNE